MPALMGHIDVAHVTYSLPDGRVLLFPYRPPALGGRIAYWFTPGGGVQDGESLACAACSEACELSKATLAMKPCATSAWFVSH